MIISKKCRSCGKKIKEGEYCIACSVKMAKLRNPNNHTKYCPSCGEGISDEMNFCPMCGTSFKQAEQHNNREDKIHWEGNIFKCPNCGEVVDAFAYKCDSCGYEFRNTSSSNAVKAFSKQLNDALTQEQKISIIQGFPIPNNREDLCEFLLMAGANIDPSVLTETGRFRNRKEYAVSEAWRSKFENAYQKARAILINDQRWPEIQRSHDNVERAISKQKRKEWIPAIGVLVGMVLMYAVLMINIRIDNNNALKEIKEVESQIQSAMDEKNYEEALLLTSKFNYINTRGADGSAAVKSAENYWYDLIVLEADKENYDLSKAIEQLKHNDTEEETKD